MCILMEHKDRRTLDLISALTGRQFAKVSRIPGHSQSFIFGPDILGFENSRDPFVLFRVTMNHLLRMTHGGPSTSPAGLIIDLTLKRNCSGQQEEHMDCA